MVNARKPLQKSVQWSLFIVSSAIGRRYRIFSFRICQSWHDVKTKGAVGAVFALLRNWQLGALFPITLRDSAVTLKGSYRMGDGRIFSKNLRASLFNDDLPNEPNFGLIHFVGQHL